MSRLRGGFTTKRNGNVLAARSPKTVAFPIRHGLLWFYYTTARDGLQGLFSFFPQVADVLEKVADFLASATISATISATLFWLYIAIIFFIFIKVAQVADI